MSPSFIYAHSDNNVGAVNQGLREGFEECGTHVLQADKQRLRHAFLSTQILNLILYLTSPVGFYNPIV